MAGILSGIPYFGMFVFLPIAGFLADFVTTKQYLTKTQVNSFYSVPKTSECVC